MADISCCLCFDSSAGQQAARLLPAAINSSAVGLYWQGFLKIFTGLIHRFQAARTKKFFLHCGTIDDFLLFMAPDERPY